jgi:hypothetical protein
MIWQRSDSLPQRANKGLGELRGEGAAGKNAKYNSRIQASLTWINSPVSSMQLLCLRVASRLWAGS